MDRYNIQAYRYYKKLDWLLGIIGGAMLLFYILLWIPCSYINRNRHRVDNVSHFLMMNHAKEEEPITEEKVGPAVVSGWF